MKETIYECRSCNRDVPCILTIPANSGVHLEPVDYPFYGDEHICNWIKKE